MASGYPVIQKSLSGHELELQTVATAIAYPEKV